MTREAERVWLSARGRARFVRALPVLFFWGYLALTARSYTPAPGTAPTVAGWGWAATTVAAVAPLLWLALGRTRPAVVLTAEVVLLLAVGVAGPSPVLDVMNLLVMGSVAELAMRRRGRIVAAGYLVATTAVMISASNARADQVPPVFFPVICVLVAAPLAAGLYLRSVRTLAELAQERARELEAQRELMMSSVRAGERAAIARELHDLLAHHMSSIVMRVSAARHRRRPSVPNRDIDGPDRAIAGHEVDAEIDAVLADVHAAATTALAQMHQLLTLLRDPDAAEHELAPLLGPTDLRAALCAIVDRVSPSAPTRLCLPDVVRLDAIQALAVLRVVQESLTNVAKHSPPDSRTTVVLTQPPALAATPSSGPDQSGSAGSVAVRIEIRTTFAGGARSCATSTDGSAAPGVPKSRVGTGWGLVGMRERIAVLGGQLLAGPTSEGWSVRATLPHPSTVTEAITIAATSNARGADVGPTRPVTGMGW